jgi:GINS complex subunit 2
MALPKSLASSLSPQELAFLAENEPIEIVPLFSMTPVRLLSVSYDVVGRSRYAGHGVELKR